MAPKQAKGKPPKSPSSVMRLRSGPIKGIDIEHEASYRVVTRSPMKKKEHINVSLWRMKQ